MAIAIPIRVNTTEVSRAIKELDALDRAIARQGMPIPAGGVNPIQEDPSAVLQYNDAVKQLSSNLETLRRLGTQGGSYGLLGGDQWQKVAVSVKEVRGEIQRYERDLERVTNQLSHMSSERDKAAKRGASKGQLAAMDADIDDTRSRQQELLKRSSVYEKAQERVEQYRNTLGGYGSREAGREQLATAKTHADRLQSIARLSERNGKIDSSTLRESRRNYDEITKAVKAYQDGLAKARKELADLIREQRNIGRTSGMGAEYSDAASKTAASRARLNEMEQHRQDYDRMQQDAKRNRQTVEDAKTTAPDGMNLKRILGYGLAAAGGFSIMGFLGQSRAKYQQSVMQEATLAARGIGKEGWNDNVSIGINPLEQAALLNQISSSTGMSGDRARQAANMSGTFGRYTGTDPSQIAGLYSAMYQATGKEDAAQGVIGAMGEAIKRGMDKAKTTELLQLVSRNTQMTAQSMHGAGMDSQQMKMAVALAVEGIKATNEGKEYGTFAKSQELQNYMQGGLNFTGNVAGDMIKAQVLGYFDQEMTFERKQELEEIQEGGFLKSPEYLDKYMEAVNRFAGEGASSKTRAGVLGAIDTSLGAKARKMLIDLYDSGTIQKAQRGEVLTGDEEKAYKEWQEQAGMLPGVDKLALEAKKEVVEIKVGEKIHDIFGKFELGATEFAGALVDGNWKEAFSKLHEAIGTSGMALLAAGAGAAGLNAAGISLNIAAAALTKAATNLGIAGKTPSIPSPTTLPKGGAGRTLARFGLPAIPALLTAATGVASRAAANRVNEQHVQGMSTEAIKSMLAGTDRKSVMGGGIGIKEREILEEELGRRLASKNPSKAMPEEMQAFKQSVSQSNTGGVANNNNQWTTQAFKERFQQRWFGKLPQQDNADKIPPIYRLPERGAATTASTNSSIDPIRKEPQNNQWTAKAFIERTKERWPEVFGQPAQQQEEDGKAPIYRLPDRPAAKTSGLIDFAAESRKAMPGGSKYDELINHYSAKHGIPAIMTKAVMQQESGMNPNATSRVGAGGLMQLMPSTAADLGVKDRYDPEQNIYGGTKYLAQMLKRYGGDTNKALAAYNAGPNRLDGIIAKHGDGWLQHTPKETQNYVQSVGSKMSPGMQEIEADTTADKSSVLQQSPYAISASTAYVGMGEAAEERLASILEELKTITNYIRTNMSIARRVPVGN